MFKLFTAFSLIVSSLFGVHQPTNVGAYNPTAGGTYRLQSSVSSSATSFTLASFKEPISNIPYTMTYLNSAIEYGTFEPQSGSKEFISFSGITQNADGSARITGVTRGLGFSYPYTASTTLTNPHPGQSIFILSNPPQLTNQYANKNNTENIYGQWTYSSTSPAQYDYNPNFTSLASTTIISKGYADALSIAGSVPGTFTVPGIFILDKRTSDVPGTATKTYLGTTYNVVTDYGQATSTCAGGGSGYSIITSQALGNAKIAPGCIDVTGSYAWTTGNHSFSASTTFAATTTIAASSTTTSPLILNGRAYAFPSTQGAASTTAVNDGTGSITWQIPDWTLVATSTLTSAVSTTTLANLPARSEYMIMVEPHAVTSSSGATQLYLQFNSDVAANYGYTNTETQTTATIVSGATQKVIRLTGAKGIGNGLAALYQIRVNNITSFAKYLTWNGVSTDNAAPALPNSNTGAAVWNNTSAQISSVSVGVGDTSNPQTMGAGTRITVYASKN